MSKEYVAYFSGLKVIENFDFEFWLKAYKESFPLPPVVSRLSPQQLRRIVFKFFVNSHYHTLMPRREWLVYSQAYRTYRNRIWNAKDDQLTPPGLEELG